MLNTHPVIGHAVQMLFTSRQKTKVEGILIGLAIGLTLASGIGFGTLLYKAYQGLIQINERYIEAIKRQESLLHELHQKAKEDQSVVAKSIQSASALLAAIATHSKESVGILVGLHKLCQLQSNNTVNIKEFMEKLSSGGRGVDQVEDPLLKEDPALAFKKTYVDEMINQGYERDEALSMAQQAFHNDVLFSRAEVSERLGW